MNAGYSNRLGGASGADSGVDEAPGYDGHLRHTDADTP